MGGFSIDTPKLNIGHMTSDLGSWAGSQTESLDIGKSARQDTQAAKDAGKTAKTDIAGEKAVTDAAAAQSFGIYGTQMGQLGYSYDPKTGLATYDPNKDQYNVDKVKLSDAEIAMLDKSQANQEGRVKGMMARLGMTNSTMAASMLNQVDQDRLIAEGGMLAQDKKDLFDRKMEVFKEADANFKNSTAALGLSNLDVQQMLVVDQNINAMQMNQQNQLTEVFSALLGTTATFIPKPGK